MNNSMQCANRSTSQSRRWRGWMAAFWLVGSAISHATIYEDELLSLQIPAGFQGPVRATPVQNTTIIAYTKPKENGVGTLLEISVYDFGSQLAGLPKEKLGDGADRYIGQFLQGVERRRTAFSASAPVRVSLDGIPAARVSWHGMGEGHSMVGTMYCVIVGTRVISFHTQTEQQPSMADFGAAMTSIEAVRFQVPGA
jgi:hypothetical protein